MTSEEPVAKPRVFVSSVVTGFETYREAAREAVEAVGGEPILVNEDFPAYAASSRNVCLDAVASADVLLSIVGARGGWTAPSGLLVIEEELEEAKRRKVPVLGFVQAGVDREEDAERFVHVISDYVTGRFRLTFRTEQDLRAAIERSLTPLLAANSMRNMTRELPDHFSAPPEIPHVAMLRFVLIPERHEEVIDPVRMASDGFRLRLMEVGHGSGVRLLSYEDPKTATRARDSIAVEQTPANGRHGAGDHVRLAVFESGDVVVDINVSGRRMRGSAFDMMDAMVLAAEDIEEALAICFAFADALYEDLDRFGRHQTFFFNAALSGVGHRRLERDPKPRNSFGLSMRSDRAIFLAHDRYRRISREDLRLPKAEVHRAIVRFEQRLKD